MSDLKTRALEILNHETVSVIPKPPKIIQIDSKASLYEGFETLVSNHILSAPVYDESTHQYIGFLDIRDLVSFVVFVYDEQKVHDNARLEELIKHGIGQFKMKTTEGVTVSYLSRRHRFKPVKETDNLMMVVNSLADPDIHRVPVIDGSGKVVNIISQYSIIKHLSQKCVKIPIPDDEKTLKEINIGSHPVLTVNQNESVINTFRTMDSKNKSGIALVNGSGRIVGTTTGKDLGLFLKNPTLSVLNHSIFEHLQKIRGESVNIQTPAITVFDRDTLSRAISLLAATRVHRVFVVDNETNYHPTRVISITDILNYLKH
eukprot:TRINITY_DN946_c0_g1_i2.p1 TRINITY_DN946_c0_g1~~TRINITY_DN946_c0_g1_i2.p1  ORF type:complete len:317 (+),score=66.95 TRINITY_DN946_c0_g1_i2:800-1750(+)